MKRYTIQRICRKSEYSDGTKNSYEYGYSIIDNLYGDYLYEIADANTACWYREHNYILEL